jgi:hypothetical protein
MNQLEGIKAGKEFIHKEMITQVTALYSYKAGNTRK